MSTLTDVEYDDCVICLNKRQIFIKCNQCHSCKICGPCTDSMIEQGLEAKCPTCRLVSPWISTCAIHIQDLSSSQAFPEIIIHPHDITSPRVRASLHSVRLPQITVRDNTINANINCSPCFCIECVAFTIYNGLKKTIEILKSKTCKKIFLFLTLAYLVGILPIVIFSGKTIDNLTVSQVTWEPILFGTAIISIIRFFCTELFCPTQNMSIHERNPTYVNR